MRLLSIPKLNAWFQCEVLKVHNLMPFLNLGNAKLLFHGFVLTVFHHVSHVAAQFEAVGQRNSTSEFRRFDWSCRIGQGAASIQRSCTSGGGAWPKQVFYWSCWKRIVRRKNDEEDIQQRLWKIWRRDYGVSRRRAQSIHHAGAHSEQSSRSGQGCSTGTGSIRKVSRYPDASMKNSEHQMTPFLELFPKTIKEIRTCVRANIKSKKNKINQFWNKTENGHVFMFTVGNIIIVVLGMVHFHMFFCCIPP